MKTGFSRLPIFYLLACGCAREKEVAAPPPEFTPPGVYAPMGVPGPVPGPPPGTIPAPGIGLPPGGLPPQGVPPQVVPPGVLPPPSGIMRLPPADGSAPLESIPPGSGQFAPGYGQALPPGTSFSPGASISAPIQSAPAPPRLPWPLSWLRRADAKGLSRKPPDYDEERLRARPSPNEG